MTILCGTDFSAPASVAARVAAGIASKLAVPLRLVHVSDRIEDAAVEQVHEEARRLQSAFDLEAEGLVETGFPDERLASLASSPGVRLLVVGSLGARRQSRWLLGSVAERTAQASPVPVLVVRGGSELESWTKGRHVLRVTAGVEPTPGSLAALRWAKGLREIGATKLVVARIVWPVDEHRRMAIPPPIPLDRLRPELESALLDETRTWASEIELGPDVSFIVGAGWGRFDVRLCQVAEELGPDLLVVGSHRRAAIARLWQGSVSRGVLHGAPMSVACVPPATAG